MKILALITARGGSKRIPGKNIRKLCGKPLIEWSIDSAKNIDDICDVLVSTDDELIANISRKAGAMVPWLRPSEMAQDDSSSVPTSLHALEWYQSHYGRVDGLLLLQPTSPFRTRKTIIKGIKLFEKKSMQTVVGFSPVEAHPFWCFKLENGVMKKFISNQGQHFQSQDLPPAFIVNGAFYLISPDSLKNNQSFYKGNIIPLIIDNYKESVDIDNEKDWEFAEMIGSKSTSSQ